MADVTTIETFPVHRIFGATLTNIADAVPAYEEEIIIDVELVLRNLMVQSGGIPIFAPKQSQQSTELKLSTQIRVRGKQTPAKDSTG